MLANQLAILKQGVQDWNRWRNDNPTVRPQLSKADLSCRILGDVNFVKADLRECDFTNTNLQNADLRGANLDGADLSGANLNGARR